jgi:hypothetical protein
MSLMIKIQTQRLIKKMCFSSSDIIWHNEIFGDVEKYFATCHGWRIFLDLKYIYK